MLRRRAGAGAPLESSVRSRVVLAALTVVLCAALVPPAAAGTAVGSFEIDGNTPDSPAGEPTDWDGAASSNPPLTVTNFTDATGNGDDSFKEGSKQEEPGAWACLTGSAPPKDDITKGAVAFRMIAGKQFAYVNFTRKSTTGTADLDYEFNQSGAANTSCPVLPRRTADDIVIAFDADNGGATIQVRAFKWAGDSLLGQFIELPVGSKGMTFDGATNGDGTNRRATSGRPCST